MSKNRFFILGNATVLDSTAKEPEAHTMAHAASLAYGHALLVHAPTADAACEQAAKLTGEVFFAEKAKAAA